MNYYNILWHSGLQHNITIYNNNNLYWRIINLNLQYNVGIYRRQINSDSVINNYIHLLYLNIV